MALKIYLYGAIDEGTMFMKGPDGKELAGNADAIRKLLENNPNEKDIEVQIHSPGGSVSEGFAIYDTLRTSGRDIHCNIVGNCHSMAVVVLLAAPLKWRTANPNARSLIHKVRSFVPDGLTDTELRQLADETRLEEAEMIKLYVNRTKLTEKKAKELIEAEKIHTAQNLLDLGFIGAINNYTTNKSGVKTVAKKAVKTHIINQKAKKMATTEKDKKNKKTLAQRATDFFNNLAVIVDKTVNFDFLDGEENVLFSTAGETEALEVGMEVSFPDADTEGGTFELADGRTVVIEAFLITEIIDPTDETTEDLKKENESLREMLAEAKEIIEGLQEQITSNYTPGNRSAARASVATKAAQADAKAKQNAEDRKNEIREKSAKAFRSRTAIVPRAAAQTTTK